MSEDVGSIGSVVPSYDEGNDRLKGFITNPEGIVAVNRDSELIRERFQDLEEDIKKYEPGRITLRSIVKEGLEVDTDYNIETRIPLSGDFNEFDLVYFGKNFGDRKTSSRIENLEDKLYNECLEEESTE